MKRVLNFFKISLCMVFIATSFLFAFNLTQQKNTNAVESNEVPSCIVSDDNFSMTMTAYSRTGAMLPFSIQTIENTVGDTVDYICFNWRDIDNLHFVFTGHPTETTEVVSYQFKLTYVCSDSLKTHIGVEEAKVLYEGGVTQSYGTVNYYYFIDSTYPVEQTETISKGNDFGLYKFDLVYTHIVENENVPVSIGEFYVGIIPDDIDEAIAKIQSVQIEYTVSSSNRLLNVYKVSLNTIPLDALKYVNPAYIVWSASGQDVNGKNYVLDKEMQGNPEYGDSDVLWESFPNKNGTNFTFDSNDVEGIWKVEVSIKGKDGEEKMHFEVNDLSTIKVEHASYVWLWFLIVILALILILLIIILILMKRRKKEEKVW